MFEIKFVFRKKLRDESPDFVLRRERMINTLEYVLLSANQSQNKAINCNKTHLNSLSISWLIFWLEIELWPQRRSLSLLVTGGAAGL